MEKLNQEEEALGVYEAAIPLLRNLHAAHAPPSEPLQHHPSFVKYRELWRWAERLLWRASCLSAKYGFLERSLSIFRVYATHTLFFPADFRPNHRHVVTALHLHALLITCPGSSLTMPHQTKLSWITEARTLLGEYRLVLAATTRFPRSGERNVQVEEYCDAVMAVWERGGAKGNDSQWAIDVSQATVSGDGADMSNRYSGGQPE
jgi:hypothetical protein